MFTNIYATPENTKLNVQRDATFALSLFVYRQFIRQKDVDID